MTVRKLWKTPLKVGDRLHCYWNLASKEKKKIFEAQVTDVKTLPFKEIKNSDTGRFENSANSFKNFESASLSDLNGSDISSSYFDSKKAKLCIKNTYAHLSPYINQGVINKSTGKYLSGYRL